MTRRTPGPAGAAVVATLLALAGCGYDFDRERQRVRYEVQQGQYPEAKARLNELYDSHQAGEPKKPGKEAEKSADITEKNRLLWRMERGMVATVAGELPGAAGELDDAAALVDARRTESLTREVGTFLLNDNLREYAGHPFEHIQVDYWRLVDQLVEAERALGVLGSAPTSRDAADEHFTSAVVRARRMTLEEIQETADAAGGQRYRDDPFARFMAAAVIWALPRGSRRDDDQQFAQVMFKRALDAYTAEEKALAHDSHFRWEVGRRPRLVERFAARHALSYDPGSFDDFASHYGVQIERTAAALPKGCGMLLLLDHVGFITRPQVLSIGLGVAAPKLSAGETATSFRIGGLGFWAKGPGADIATAWVVPIPADVMRHLAPGGMAVFGMEMPVHADDRANPPPARLIARPIAAAAPDGGPSAPSAPFDARLEVVSDLDAYARSTLKDEQPLLLAKSITRTVTKQIIAAQGAIQAKKAAGGGAQGEIAGALVNLFGSAAATLSETADTRAWTTLPDHIEAALVDLPAGSYSLEVDTGYGVVPVGTVQIPEGQLVVVPTRTFPERLNDPGK